MSLNVLLLILILFSSFSEEKKEFKVLFHDGVILNVKNKTPISDLDLLKSNESISLEEKAYLVFADNKGNIYEYTGPKNLDLRDIKPIGARGTKIDFELLYKDSYTLGFNQWDRPVRLYEPYNAYNGIYAVEPVCLKWIDKSNHEFYRILGISLDGDTLIDEQRDSREIKIEPPANKIVMLTIWDSNSNLLSPDYGIFPIDSNNESCESKSLATFIVTGLFLETLGEYRIAHTYYRTAFEQSSRNSIKSLYELHMKRYKKVTQ